MTKKCCKCKETKDTSEFHKNKRSSDGIQTYCKDCAKIRNREYYLRTPERNPQRRASKDTTVTASREFVWEYLTKHPCVDCGEADTVVLQFDHVRGVKKFNISDGIRQGLSVETILKEIEKCEVRCANCHTRRTARSFGWFRIFKG